MLKLFADVTPYVNKQKHIKKGEPPVPRADNVIFKLHYRVTFIILIVGSILVSSYAFIDSSGSAIQCMINKGSSIPDIVINRYCWIMSTYTLPTHFKGVPGEDILYHGVGPQKEEDEKVYHQYYQWVPLFLTLQAMFFYAPHWIWKQLDNGKMNNIIVGLQLHLEDETARTKKVNQLADYLRQRMKYRREHQSWALKFFLCECLNFINVIAQIFITDAFLGNEFTKYGTEVLRFTNMEPEDRVDPMSRVFPRMTKCMFHKYGGSGTIQRLDALCVLGMNILNEKIYIFLWFWFIILATITGCFLLVRGVQLFFPSVRDRLVKLENIGYLNKGVHRADIDNVISKITYSDWLILFYLAQSMEKKNFGALMAKLASILPEDPYAIDEEAAAKRKLRQDDDFSDDDEVKKPLDEPDNGSSSRSNTLKSPAKFGSLFNSLRRPK